MPTTPRSPRLLVALLLLGGLLVAPLAALAYQPGDQVREFQAADETGQRHALSGYRGRTLVVLFWGSRCPTDRGYARRVEELAREVRGQGGAFLGVASNGYEDAAGVAAAKRELGLSFPILLDGGGAIAGAFGATVTPTAYVIDGQGVVRYQGGIDDDPGGSRSDATPHLRQAFRAVARGQAPPVPSTPTRGCRIQ